MRGKEKFSGARRNRSHICIMREIEGKCHSSLSKNDSISTLKKRQMSNVKNVKCVCQKCHALVGHTNMALTVPPYVCLAWSGRGGGFPPSCYFLSPCIKSRNIMISRLHSELRMKGVKCIESRSELTIARFKRAINSLE